MIIVATTCRLTLVAFVAGEEAHDVWMTNDDGVLLVRRWSGLVQSHGEGLAYRTVDVSTVRTPEKFSLESFLYLDCTLSNLNSHSRHHVRGLPFVVLLIQPVASFPWW